MLPVDHRSTAARRYRTCRRRPARSTGPHRRPSSRSSQRPLFCHASSIVWALNRPRKPRILRPRFHWQPPAGRRPREDLEVRVAVHDSRQNDRNPVIWQAGQDYRAADVIQGARRHPAGPARGRSGSGPNASHERHTKEHSMAADNHTAIVENLVEDTELRFTNSPTWCAWSTARPVAGSARPYRMETLLVGRRTTSKAATALQPWERPRSSPVVGSRPSNMAWNSATDASPCSPSVMSPLPYHRPGDSP